MNAFSEKALGVLKTIAPTVATVLGSPLAGLAVQALVSLLPGQSPPAGQPVGGAVMGNLETAILSGSPDTLAKLRQIDAALKTRLRELDIDERRLEIQAAGIEVADRASARSAFAGNPAVFWLGMAILSAFTLLAMTAVVGGYLLASGNPIFAGADPTVMAAVFGLTGTVVGYVAALASDVTKYFFGSSAGSKKKGDEMGAALGTLTAAVTRRQPSGYQPDADGGETVRPPRRP